MRFSVDTTGGCTTYDLCYCNITTILFWQIVPVIKFATSGCLYQKSHLLNQCDVRILKLVQQAQIKAITQLSRFDEINDESTQEYIQTDQKDYCDMIVSVGEGQGFHQELVASL